MENQIGPNIEPWRTPQVICVWKQIEFPKVYSCPVNFFFFLWKRCLSINITPSITWSCIIVWEVLLFVMFIMFPAERSEKAMVLLIPIETVDSAHWVIAPWVMDHWQHYLDKPGSQQFCNNCINILTCLKAHPSVDGPRSMTEVCLGWMCWNRERTLLQLCGCWMYHVSLHSDWFVRMMPESFTCQDTHWI